MWVGSYITLDNLCQGFLYPHLSCSLMPKKDPAEAVLTLVERKYCYLSFRFGWCISLCWSIILKLQNIIHACSANVPQIHFYHYVVSWANKHSNQKAESRIYVYWFFFPFPNISSIWQYCFDFGICPAIYVYNFQNDMLCQFNKSDFYFHCLNCYKLNRTGSLQNHILAF